MHSHAEGTHVTALKYLLLGGFVLLGLLYTSAAPILEKNDEDNHLALVIHFAHGGGLPVQLAGEQTAWAQEGSQPPLYYWLASLPARLFDTSDFAFQARPNASPQYSALFPSNKNKHLLTPQKFAFGYAGSMLAAYVLRVLGIAAGVATVWFTFKLAQRVTLRQAQGRPHVALLAMGLAAFNPMLLTVTTAVSNDGLVIALSAAAMWLLAECVMGGITTRRAMALGALLGLASLAKVSGTLLLPIAVMALLAKSILNERRSLFDWRSYRFAAIVALVWIAIAGWWFARNHALYGDFTGTAMMVQVAGARIVPIEPIGEFRGFRMTFLGIFGQTNVPLDAWVYGLWDGFIALALAGLAMAWLARRRDLTAQQRIMFMAMGAHVLLVAGSIAVWTSHVSASHGRLLFPALPSVAALLAIGIAQLFKGMRLPQRATAWAALPFVAVAALAPIATIAPAYRPPLIAALPADATPAQLTLAPYAEVMGYRMTPSHARPGDTVRVAVYLRALQRTPSDYLLATKLFGRDDAPLARFDTYSGGGLLPSSEWQAGQMWVDEMDFHISDDAKTPAILRLQFALFNAYFGKSAKNFDANGKAGSPLFAASTLLPATQPISTQPLATFGEIVQLDKIEAGALRAGAPLTATLQWQPLDKAQQDFTVFVHLLDANGQLIAQSDSPPDAGQFPATRWVAGATFSETRVLVVPANAHAGAYRLSIGMYDSKSGARLPAVDTGGNTLVDNVFNAGAGILVR